MNRSPFELIGCPFCGARPRISDSLGKLSASCVNPKCKMKPSTWLQAGDVTDLRVIAKHWNTRAKWQPGTQEAMATEALPEPTDNIEAAQ